MAERQAWVDAAKGIGILLVVVGHVGRGIQNAHIIPADGWNQALDQWIYSFHMPLFFAASGYCAAGRRNSNWRVLVLSSLSRIMYPYLVWSVIQTSLQLLLSKYTNTPASWSDLWGILYSPVMQFWFLYALFLIVLIHQVLARTLRAPVVVVAVSVALHFCYPDMGWRPLSQAIHFLPYYAAAFAVAPHSAGWKDSPAPRCLAMGSCLLAGIGVVVSTGLSYVDMGLAVAGIVGVVSVALACVKYPCFQFFEFWGKASLAIYVAHTLASASMRIGLVTLGVRAPAIHLLLGTAAGVLGPLMLLGLCERKNIPYLFTLKRLSTA